ncbi:MAG: peptidoglycan D,D-transpeptidase FtsI family protein [Gammaproteobacteria bacterium]
MIDYQRKKKTSSGIAGDCAVRRKFVVALMMGCMAVLIMRAVDLQVLNKKFLKEQGDKKHVDDISVSAYRGMIKDRNGEPLAISTPVQSVWVNAKNHHLAEQSFVEKLKKWKLSQEKIAEELKNYKLAQLSQIREIEKILNLPEGKVAKLLNDDPSRQFAYAVRRIDPGLAERVRNLNVPGVNFEREFKRYYPAGAVSAHMVGFTDLNDIGQEGLEKGFEKHLRGVPGSKRVIRDGRRRIIDDIENIREPVSGSNLELSIDQRIQYLAFRELQSAVEANKAKSGTLVVLDAKTGEVLAAVNQPSFNPNTRKGLKEFLYRNRALTEVFEPGSTVKPFVVAAALEGGYVRLNSIFVTNGVYRIGRHTVKDVHNYGTLDLMHVLKKSSNVAVSQIALKMPPEYFWGVYHRLGFGISAETGFPNEASGSLLDFHKWKDFDRAVLSFGYGVSASALQLARAYTALADDGILHSASIFKRDEDPDAKRVFSVKTARSVRKMLESVIMKDGTAYEARVDGYTVAGKTGTVKKAGAHGYTSNKYFAVFAGMAPAREPRLIITIMIDEPSAGQYYGGLVSAPVFSKVMTGALRILGIAPDQEETMPILLTRNDP